MEYVSKRTINKIAFVLFDISQKQVQMMRMALRLHLLKSRE